MKKLICAALILASCDFAFAEYTPERGAEIDRLMKEWGQSPERRTELRARINKVMAQIQEQREIPGALNLDEVLGRYFSSVHWDGDVGLVFNVRRAATRCLRLLDVSSQRSISILPGATIAIRPGEKKVVVGENLEISVNRDIPADEGCGWLARSAYKVYLRFVEDYNSSSPTVSVSSYVVSPDLRKAYSYGACKDIPYPFPFVSPEPDITQEEFDHRRDLENMVENVTSLTSRLSSVGATNGVRVCRAQREYGVVEYAAFDADRRPCALAVHSDAEHVGSAALSLWRFSLGKGRFEVVGAYRDMPLGRIAVLDNGSLVHDDDAAHKRELVRDILRLLELSPADFPGINLDAILGESEAKK